MNNVEAAQAQLRDAGVEVGDVQHAQRGGSCSSVIPMATAGLSSNFRPQLAAPPPRTADGGGLAEDDLQHPRAGREAGYTESAANRRLQQRDAGVEFVVLLC